MLAIHQWDKEAKQMVRKLGLISNANNQGSSIFNASSDHTTLQSATEHNHASLNMEEEILIIPVEDVIKIEIESKVNKSSNQTKETALKAPPPQNLDCCEKTAECCTQNIFCCCSPKKKVVPETVTNVTQKDEAKRIIKFKITYVTHSFVHTPSVVTVLPKEQQNDFYKKNFATDTVQFHYLQTEEFDNDSFKKHLLESETIVKTIMQLKAMNNNYPDPTQLQQIMAQNHVRTFGLEPVENFAMAERTVTHGSLVSRNPTSDELK